MAVLTINYTIDGYSASGDSNVTATTVTLTPASITRITETVAHRHRHGGQLLDRHVRAELHRRLRQQRRHAGGQRRLQSRLHADPDRGQAVRLVHRLRDRQPDHRDTTEFYVTNAAECKLVIHVGQDSTP